MTFERTTQPTAYGDVPITRLSAVPYGQPDFTHTKAAQQKARGASGTVIQQGVIVSEEPNPELTWKQAIRTWDIMRRTDPQIASTLLMMELPILSAAWKIAPATQSPEDVEIASFVETALFHTMARPWEEILRHALLHLQYGFMAFEITWQFVEGKTVLRDVAPRLPRTINKWWTDDDNNLTGIQQWVWKGRSYDYIDIPADVLMVLSHRREGNDYEGRSILRSAWKPYWIKQTLERVQSIGFERQHVGIPVVTLPVGFTDKDVTNAGKIGKNMRSHESSFVTLPPDWTIDWLKASSGDRKGASLQDTLYYLDRQIQQNVLAQFMSLGTTDVGSYALSNDQSRVFLMSLQAIADYIASEFNRGPIKKLVDFNFPHVSIYPKLITQKLHAYNFVDLTTSIANLVGTGVIPVTAELEDFVYDVLGIPMPPRNVVEASNGVTGDGETTLKPRGSIVVNPNLGLPGDADSSDSATSAQGLSDTYRAALTRLTGTQRAVYKRMAAEASRPRIERRAPIGPALRLTTKPAVDKHADLLERRLAISEQTRSTAETLYETLYDEVEAMLESSKKRDRS